MDSFRMHRYLINKYVWRQSLVFFYQFCSIIFLMTEVVFMIQIYFCDWLINIIIGLATLLGVGKMLWSNNANRTCYNMFDCAMKYFQCWNFENSMKKFNWKDIRIEHLRQRQIAFPKTFSFIKNTPLHIVFSTLFLVFGKVVRLGLLCEIYYYNTKTTSPSFVLNVNFIGTSMREVFYLPCFLIATQVSS